MATRFPLSILFLGLLLSLAACCGSSTCDECQDAHADAIYLQFSVDSSATGNGFRAAELDTIQLIRQAVSEKITPRRDTARIVLRRTAVADSIRLDRTLPFPARDTLVTEDYTYSILLPNAKPAQRYELTEVNIEGSFEADGCCTCYRNRVKTLQLDGRPLDLTDPAGNNGIVPIRLTRK
ncbi:hypothetical protein LRS06_04830 [Hymenobacter sp. J193]|uniref:hypothetical protein n=1 Tax=Hymenobacter sp. J193 TaxID=2898429 RepID=UPI002150FCF9|nr:hypothetical protein [Hymenobacter sp. J193]MCR5887111.1 hypothetical protein [Hymenobacter sp. J193]